MQKSSKYSRSSAESWCDSIKYTKVDHCKSNHDCLWMTYVKSPPSSLRFKSSWMFTRDVSCRFMIENRWIDLLCSSVVFHQSWVWNMIGWISLPCFVVEFFKCFHKPQCPPIRRYIMVCSRMFNVDVGLVLIWADSLSQSLSLSISLFLFPHSLSPSLSLSLSFSQPF